MAVHTIGKACIALNIGRRLMSQFERPTVRKDQPGPGELQTILGEAQMIVVAADQTSALGNQLETARHAVEYILRHLGHDRAWDVGSYAGDQRGPYDRAGLQEIGRG